LHCRKFLSEKTSIADVDIVLASSAIPSYNPHAEFIANLPEANTELPTIKRLLKIYHVPESKERYFTKWLVGFAAVLRGEYSPLVLALYGPQGTGKTYFFQKLLPPELGHPASYGLKERVEEVAATHMLLYFDEGEGLSKSGYERLNSLATADRITYNPKYLEPRTTRRIAVLGLTTNDPGILTDPVGNRRIIIHQLNYRVDLHAYDAVDRYALFSELLYMYDHMGVSPHLTPTEIVQMAPGNQDYKVLPIEEELIRSFYQPNSVERPGSHEGGEWHTCAWLATELQKETRIPIDYRGVGKTLSRLSFTHKFVRGNKYYLLFPAPNLSINTYLDAETGTNDL